MGQTPEGRKQLMDLYKIDAFVDASPTDFEPVREAFEKVGLHVN
jgi:ABC-type phosphate/phosphonate transport system substrate-binding protein